MINHHPKVLHEPGLLDRSRRGTWVYHRVRSAALSDVAALLTPTGEPTTPRSCS